MQRLRENNVVSSMAAAMILEQDTRWMLSVQAGDAASFGLLLEKYRAPIVNYLYRMVHNHAVAEELAQDVFVRVYRSRMIYQPSAKFTTWLFRIATNVALNWRRDERYDTAQLRIEDFSSHARRFDPPDSRRSVEALMVNEVRVEEIRAAIRSLPDKQQAAVLMHKYEEMEYVQIALALGCSVQAVKSLLFRAYETLRCRLAHFQMPAAKTACGSAS